MNKSKSKSISTARNNPDFLNYNNLSTKEKLYLYTPKNIFNTKYNNLKTAALKFSSKTDSQGKIIIDLGNSQFKINLCDKQEQFISYVNSGISIFSNRNLNENNEKINFKLKINSEVINNKIKFNKLTDQENFSRSDFNKKHPETQKAKNSGSFREFLNVHK